MRETGDNANKENEIEVQSMKEKISDTQGTVSPGFRLSTHMRQDCTISK